MGRTAASSWKSCSRTEQRWGKRRVLGDYVVSASHTGLSGVVPNCYNQTDLGAPDLWRRGWERLHAVHQRECLGVKSGRARTPGNVSRRHAPLPVQAESKTGCSVFLTRLGLWWISLVALENTNDLAFPIGQRV